jgi:hypothetical protein
MHFNQKRKKNRQKKEETIIGDKSLDHHRHTLHQEEDRMMALPVTWRKAIFGQTVTSRAPSQ